MNTGMHTQRSRSEKVPGRILRRSLSPLLSCSPARLLTLLLLAVVVPLHAAPLLSTNLPPVSPSLPDASFSVIRVFGAFVLVIGLFLAGAWVFKNWQRLGLQRGRATQLQILESKSLGGRHALYVVSYQHQRLLLASSPAGVTLVSHLPDDDTPAATANTGPAIGGENFVHALQQAVQARA